MNSQFHPSHAGEGLITYHACIHFGSLFPLTSNSFLSGTFFLAVNISFLNMFFYLLCDTGRNQNPPLSVMLYLCLGSYNSFFLWVILNKYTNPNLITNMTIINKGTNNILG